MNLKIPRQSLRRKPAGGEAASARIQTAAVACGLACVWALSGAAGWAQTLNLPATLTAGVYTAASTVTNCTGTVSQANCTSVTLASNATVSLIAGTQIVLGPGFTAVASSGSATSLTAMIGSPPLPTVSGVSITPASVTSGSSAQVTVTLTSNAPLGGSAVVLSSSNTAAFSTPASITVNAGTATNSASVTAGMVSASTPVTLTGSYNSSSGQGSVTVVAPSNALIEYIRLGGKIIAIENRPGH
jgi:hypothetical protein